MSWLGNLVGGGVGEIVESVGNVVDKFVTTDEEKAKAKLELQKLIQKRDSEIEQTLRQNLQAKERILVAELTQGDNYTKRARPTVVYSGLAMIAINYVVAPLIGMEAVALPAEFWYAWSGVVATWSIGRSFEKGGLPNKVAGGKRATSLLDN